MRNSLDVDDIFVYVNDNDDNGSDGYGVPYDNVDGYDIGDVDETEHEDDALDENDFVEEYTTINCFLDILNFDVLNITYEEVESLDFVDLEIAYLFYCWYAKMKGFAVRKSRVLKNKQGEIVQQTFLCSRAGLREDRGLTLESRKREIKNETRCDCKAMFRVHVNLDNGRWYVTVFNFDHNHEMLEVNECAMLPGHRKMKESDILQINNYNKVGIRVPHMYAAFANNSGGYHKVGFLRKDVYNTTGKQRRKQSSDVSGALNFFEELCAKDPMMFVSYTVDNDMRLQHLFWCDGESRLNYEVFGDVLAFDATYKKNKYHCPLVVFSGVNHHNQTIVFAAALVTNETEETYVWLLEQFMEAMNGKAPCSIITDGDVAMKNAIRHVFPNAHHRLCAWHLLRNAISNVGIPSFMPYLKRCMLGDYDVNEFEEKWNEMVAKFELQNNNWIKELYEKKHMWSTAYIRGNFFAGIRTTSRCEAFHSHVGKYVHSKINLTDFVEQFHRCLSFFRFREFEADFRSNYGEVVLTTTYQSLERSAAKLLTKELFLLFRPLLKKATLLRVVECHEMSMFSVYTVLKYCTGRRWQVSYCASLEDFKCSCQRHESIGLPCDHIISVLMCLDILEIPKSLFLGRWTRGAKDSIRDRIPASSNYWDSQSMAKYATLLQLSREVCEYAYRDDEDYSSFMQLMTGELSRLKMKHTCTTIETNVDTEVAETEVDTNAGGENNDILDPPLVRTKGCGRMSINETGRRRRVQTCRNCGSRGHNRRSCTNPPRSEAFDDICSAPELLFNQRRHMHSETFIASTSGTTHFGNMES